MPENMIFEDWSSLLRVVVLAAGGYIGLVLLLRISGKRTLTKLNAFDLVITVALGSAFANVVLSQDTPLVNGLLAFTMLILMQFVVAWLSLRVKLVKQLVKSDPRMVFYRGQYLEDVMRAERITHDEVLAAMRKRVTSVEQVEAVVFETDASLTVLTRTDTPPTVLRSVINAPEATTSGD